MTKNDFNIFVLSIAADRNGTPFRVVNQVLDRAFEENIDVGDIFNKHMLNENLENFVAQASLLQAESRNLAESFLRRQINIIGRESNYYPENLKKKLKDNAPPVLFAIGNQAVAQKKAVAVVGSRRAMDIDIEYAKKLGCVCAENGYAVVSGGAIGVDTAAQLSVLKSGGESVAYLPQGCEGSTFVKENMKYIRNGTLLCLTACRPDSRFTRELALTRNKYIHSHAQMSVTVNSQAGMGGSWSGAYDNLIHSRTPAFVSNIPHSGNERLAAEGASVLSYDEISRKGFSINQKIQEALKK